MNQVSGKLAERKWNLIHHVFLSLITKLQIHAAIFPGVRETHVTETHKTFGLAELDIKHFPLPR